ncbi:zeta toxin family protein [Beauveria brongniartii RCEF 3172]|uniref:Zeta toxin family protein n=1 Tax=Beauveria brongniartii RCEF 3172 TaxID=1081107 RepID=A0A162LZ27_9HYPO|nr:zeta toxin family protein [Beauveria brongniartii RCEF 3172]
MPPPPDLSSYRLSNAESQRIFQEQILPAEFPASPSPAVGQTGAGKTLLAPAILQALSASRRKPFRAARYRVEVVVLAVPAALSRLGILARFYEKKPEARSRGLPVRLTPVKVHDDSYAGLLHAARYLESSGAADQVVVVRRGNFVAYGWERAGGEASKIAEAVERERERRLTEAERKTALEDVQRLEVHEGANEQLEQVRELLRPLISDASHDATHSTLVPIEFARKDGDERASNVLRLGHA